MISGDFKSNDFASAYSKGVAGAFFASAHSKGLASVDVGQSVTAVRVNRSCKALGGLCNSCYLAGNCGQRENELRPRKCARLAFETRVRPRGFRIEVPPASCRLPALRRPCSPGLQTPGFSPPATQLLRRAFCAPRLRPETPRLGSSKEAMAQLTRTASYRPLLLERLYGKR